MDIEKLQEFFFWCLVLNVAIYAFTALAILLLRNFMSSIHEKLFGLSQETVRKAFYTYLAAYKLLIIVFNFVPWLALVLLD
jgi:hypothetical protein